VLRCWLNLTFLHCRSMVLLTSWHWLYSLVMPEFEPYQEKET
jgi:hypothetical protein